MDWILNSQRTHLENKFMSTPLEHTFQLLRVDRLKKKTGNGMSFMSCSKITKNNFHLFLGLLPEK